MLLFTNDVLDMASAKSIGKGTNNIRYWHTFSEKVRWEAVFSLLITLNTWANDTRRGKEMGHYKARKRNEQPPHRPHQHHL